jgi:hypothetical protein
MGTGQGNRMKAITSSFRQGVPESSARDGNLSDAQVIDLITAVGHSLPSLDDGCIRDILVPHPSGGEAQANRLSCRFVRHPCRNDGAFCLSDDMYCFMRLP